MRDVRVYFISFLLVFTLFPSSQIYVNGVGQEDVKRIGSTELLVRNNHTYSYVNEPITTYLTFSQGEAYNNSIRIYDSSKNEIPSQMWNVEYYPGGKYIRTCNITFLANLTANKESYYLVTYSPSDIGISNYSAWSDLKTSGDGFRGDIKVENSYFIAFIKANSTLGIYKFYLKPSNVSLIWENSSLTGFTFSVDGIYYTTNDLKVKSVSVVKGPVFTQVTIVGSLEDIIFYQDIIFYARSPCIDSSLRIVNTRKMVDWIRPMQIFFRQGVFENYTLSTGMSGSLKKHALDYPLGNAYRPQEWWSLGGKFGSILFVQKPIQNISFIILHETSSFVTVANVGNETLLNNKPRKINYFLRIFFFERGADGRAKAIAKMFNQPAQVSVKLPIAFLSIDVPSRKQIYSKFNVTVTINVLQDINNCTLVLIAPDTKLNVSGKISAYLGFLKKNSIRTVSWTVFGTSAGAVEIGAVLKSKEGSTNASTSIFVYIPVIAPPVKVKLRVLDFSGRLNMSLVNVTFLDKEGLVRSNPPWRLTDRNGSAEFFLEPGIYIVKISDRGRIILTKNITISGPVSLTLNCWVYTINFHVLGPDGKNLPKDSRALVILYENVTGKLVPVASAVSNATGYARLNGIYNGTYIVKGYVRNAEAGELNIEVSSDESTYQLPLKFLTMITKVVSDVGKPVGNCTISIYDKNGHLVDIRLTDSEGSVTFSNLAFQNYTYLVDWFGTRVASGFIYPDKLVTNITIQSKVYTVTIEAIDIWGNSLKGASLTIRPLSGRASKNLVTDDLGKVTVLVSIGNYSVNVKSAGYIGSEIINVKSSKIVQVKCSPNSILYILFAMSGSSWVALGLVWRWRTREVSYEELKVKDMLAKLEDLYAAGEVEYPLYRKLKDEYSSRLRRVRTK